MARTPATLKGAALLKRQGIKRLATQISDFVNKLDEQREQLTADGDYEALALTAALAKTLADQLSVYTRSARADVGDILRNKMHIRGSIVIDGLDQPVKVEAGYETKCEDPQELVLHIVKSMLVDRDTGEIDQHDLRVAETVLGIVFDVVSISPRSMRITVVREYLENEGDEADYFTKTPKTPMASLPKLTAEAFA